MKKINTHTFSATIDIIGINPFVLVPEEVLAKIFKQAGKDRGAIAIKGTVNKKPFTQSLVKFRGAWRFYINTAILKDSPKRIGEVIAVSIAYNPLPAAIVAPAAFTEALAKDKKAKAVFDTLPVYLQKEINRYLLNLKTAQSLEKNIARALNFLKGKERFVGRELPL